VVHKVAVISGITPKLASANLGAQRVPVKKSTGLTNVKNSSDGWINAIKIPTVMNIEKIAAPCKSSLAARSP
jgi:hypothetical protein